MMRADEIDLLDPRAYADSGQPWEMMRWLQENDPISWQREPNGGPGFWAVTRYADLKTVEGDWRTFSSQPAATIADNALGDDDHRIMIWEDPPNHTSHREFIGQELFPASVKRMRPRVEQIATDVVDEVIERGQCDLVWDVAGKMASYVMADLLGMSRDEAVDMYDAVEASNNAGSYTDGEGLAAAMRLAAHASTAWNDRRAKPGTDVLSRLANGEIRGCPMDELQFTLDFHLLVSGAGDTTRNVIAGGMDELFKSPEQREILAGADEAGIAMAVEEMLRWVSPVSNQRRTATVDTELGGHRIRKGEKVASFYGIANRDPAQFPDPWKFNVRREPNAHVAFGFGRHFCTGSHLARLELNAMFRVLLDRLPDLEPTGPTKWTPVDAPVAPNMIGPKFMPVRFTPGPKSTEKISA